MRRSIATVMYILFSYVLTSIAQTTIAETAVAQHKKPNIIVILTDDMGYGDISIFGGKLLPTPNIDRLAERGLRLSQYYSGAPICSPSRASIITGMYPGRWNFSTYLDNRKHNKAAEQADFLDPRAPSVARFFQEAGYATGHFGKWHLGGGRDVHDAPGFEQYGYDEHISTYESPDPDPLITASNWIWSPKDSIKRWDRTRYFVDKTLAFLKDHKGTPCFVNLWPDDVHTPWVPHTGEGYAGKFPMGQEDEAAFKLVLKEFDVQIGRLMEGLKEMGIDRETIVIFTSDNGPLPSFRGSRTEGMRGSKLSLYEGGTRMPFIISWPGQVPQGQRDEISEISALDLWPSLARMAGIELPADFKGDGVDRSTVFKGQPSARGKSIFWEYGRNDEAFRYPKGVNRSPRLAVRSAEWKLLMNYDGSGVELYNILEDRNETTNVSTQHPEVASRLKRELATWWKDLKAGNR